MNISSLTKSQAKKLLKISKKLNTLHQDLQLLLLKVYHSSECNTTDLKYILELHDSVWQCISRSDEYLQDVLSNFNKSKKTLK